MTSNSLSQAVVVETQMSEIGPQEAPARPDKSSKKSASAFRTISEVADELEIQQHVLRFWETKFSQVRPLKRGGGRRYYRPEDVALLKRIHHLLYTDGYTIKGVQKLLKGQGKAKAAQAKGGQSSAAQATQAPSSKASTVPVTGAVAAGVQTLSPRQRSVLEGMLVELKELRAMVKGA